MKSSPQQNNKRFDIDALNAEYGEPLRRYFARHLSRPDDAEDMVQEVFTRLLRSTDTEPIANPQAFLFRIASNLLLDRRRRNTVRQLNQHEPYDETYHAHEVISPERVLIGKQELQRLKKAILALPPNVRAAFILHRFEGLKYKEISETLNISVSSVEKYMMTAIARLSKEFGRK